MRWWLDTTPNLLGRPWAQENAAQGRGGGAGQGVNRTNRNGYYKKQMCGLTIGFWNKSRVPFETLKTKLGE